MTEYKKTNKRGTFWQESDSKVIWKGSIHATDSIDLKNPDGPNKDQEKYYSILKTQYGSSEAKYELVQSVGLLYLKSGNAKDTAPNIGGPVTVDLGQGVTVSQKFGAWYEEVNVKGILKKKLSVGLIDHDDQQITPYQSEVKKADDDIFPPVTTAFDDDAPF